MIEFQIRSKISIIKSDEMEHKKTFVIIFKFHLILKQVKITKMSGSFEMIRAPTKVPMTNFMLRKIEYTHTHTFTLTLTLTLNDINTVSHSIFDCHCRHLTYVYVLQNNSNNKIKYT